MTVDAARALAEALDTIPGADRVPAALDTLDTIALQALHHWYTGTGARPPTNAPPTVTAPRHETSARQPARDMPTGAAPRYGASTWRSAHDTSTGAVPHDGASAQRPALDTPTGAGPRPEASARPPARDSPVGVASRHAALARRWVDAVKARPWAAAGPPDIDRDGERIERAYAELGFPPRMARFHRDTLAALPGLIRDEISVHRLLFGEGDVLGGLAAYQDNLVTRALNAACARVVARLARDRTAPLRVLELGGGAGLTTDATLAALGGRAVSYRFSDVSPLFTRAVSARHGARAGLVCDLIDIDHDLEPQGVADRSVDVVLAGNVLHNAADLGRTLRRIRRALAPDGTLLFTEAVSEPPAVLTSMSLLLSPAPGRAGPGAYDGRAARGRIFPGRHAWLGELAAAGLRPGPVAPEPDTPLGAAGQHVFVATPRP